MSAEDAFNQRGLTDIVADLTGQFVRRTFKDIHRMAVFKILRRRVQGIFRFVADMFGIQRNVHEQKNGLALFLDFFQLFKQFGVDVIVRVIHADQIHPADFRAGEPDRRSDRLLHKCKGFIFCGVGLRNIVVGEAVARTVPVFVISRSHDHAGFFHEFAGDPEVFRRDEIEHIAGVDQRIAGLFHIVFREFHGIRRKREVPLSACSKFPAFRAVVFVGLRQVDVRNVQEDKRLFRTDGNGISDNFHSKPLSELMYLLYHAFRPDSS